MDDVGRATAEEVEDQKEQTTRAVQEAVQNYGDRREEEGKKKIYKRAFLGTIFTAFSLGGFWLGDELTENSVRKNVVDKSRVKEPGLKTFGVLRAAKALNHSHSKSLNGITQFLESEEQIDAVANELSFSFPNNSEVASKAAYIENTVLDDDQSGDSRGGNYRFHVGPVIGRGEDETRGFQNVDIGRYLETHKDELSGRAEDWEELANIDFTDDQYGLAYLSDGGRQVDEDSVMVLNEAQTEELLNAFNTENPSEYDFDFGGY